MYRYEQASWPRRVMRQSGAVPPITWFYARALQHIDAVVYRASRGRATFTSWVAGLPIVMLTHRREERPQPRCRCSACRTTGAWW